MGQFGECIQPCFPENVSLFLLVIEEECGVESQDSVARFACKLEYFFELRRVVLERVEEVEPVVIFKLLIGQLISVVNSLAQRFLAQKSPVFLCIYLRADLECQLEITGLNCQCESFLGRLSKFNCCSRITLAHQVPYQVFLFLAQFSTHHFLHATPFFLLNCQLKLNVFIFGTLYFEHLPRGVEGQEATISQFAHQMQWLFKCFKDTGLSVEKSILPMVFGCVEKQVVALPESRLNGKLLVDSRLHLKLQRAHQKYVPAAQCYSFLSDYYTPDVCTWLHCSLSYYLSCLEIVFEHSLGSGENEVVLVWGTEESQQGHFVRQPQNLFLIVSLYTLDMYFGWRDQDSHVSLGEKAAIDCLILPANVGEIQIALLLLYDESLKAALVHLNHKDRRVKLVYNKSAYESQGILVLWVILVQFFLLHIFLNIVKQGLHALCEHKQASANKPVWNYFPIQLPHLEA